jgi:hypothetical protein
MNVSPLNYDLKQHGPIGATSGHFLDLIIHKYSSTIK